MRGADEPIDRLRDALGELAAQDAPGLLADARAEARERVRADLSEALAEALLRRVGEELAQAPAPRAEPARDREEPAAAPAREPRQPAELVCYVYGVIGAGAESSLPGLDGVLPGQSVAALVEGSLAAVVSPVAAHEFGEAELREHLGDMEW